MAQASRGFDKARVGMYLPCLVKTTNKRHVPHESSEHGVCSRRSVVGHFAEVGIIESVNASSKVTELLMLSGLLSKF